LADLLERLATAEAVTVLADVLALRMRETGPRAAMAELAADTEDLERTHGL
jgi:hypothetical protein